MEPTLLICSPSAEDPKSTDYRYMAVLERIAKALNVRIPDLIDEFHNNTP